MSVTLYTGITGRCGLNGTVNTVRIWRMLRWMARTSHSARTAAVSTSFMFSLGVPVILNPRPWTLAFVAESRGAATALANAIVRACDAYRDNYPYITVRNGRAVSSRHVVGKLREYRKQVKGKYGAYGDHIVTTWGG